MIHQLCQRALNAARNFLRDQSGSIVIYTGAFMAVGIGGAALSIDIGRIVLLKTQMQNRADAAALAGAAQLDAQKGAVARAEYIMFDSMKAFTTAAADQGELVLYDAEFYEAQEDGISRGAVTADDNLARFAEATMERRTLSFFYAPALNIMTGKTVSSYTELDSRAVAMSDPFICKMQPLMICNPFDMGGGVSSDDLKDPKWAGIGVRIKQSGQTDWNQPGNFGLLDLPGDAAYGVSGANAVEAALAADEPKGCYSVSAMGVRTGNVSGKVKDGVNTRFGHAFTDPTIVPAPNTMNYPNDDVMIADSTLNFGDGVWDIATYWADNHKDPGGVPYPLPPVLNGASRYQVYLFEQGTVYWKGKGKKTTQVATEPIDAAANWDKVDPTVDYPLEAVIPTNPAAPDDNFTDGEPPPGQTVSSYGQARRLVKVAVADCVSNPFKGNATIPGTGSYVEFFITREAGVDGNGATIYAELVRGIEARTSVEFHGNVRLTE